MWSGWAGAIRIGLWRSATKEGIAVRCGRHIQPPIVRYPGLAIAIPGNLSVNSEMLHS